MTELFDILGVPQDNVWAVALAAAVAFLATIVALVAKTSDVKKSPKLERFVDLTELISKLVGAMAVLLTAALLVNSLKWGLVVIGIAAFLSVLYLGIALWIAKHDTSGPLSTTICPCPFCGHNVAQNSN